jgi:hypothetical protein
MRSDHERESAGRAALAVLAVVAWVALVGACGGSSMDRARTTVATTARVVAAADTVASGIVAERMDATETEAELEAERERADRVVRAFVSVHLALTAADSALDAVEVGAAEESAWSDAVACLLPPLLELVDVLAAFGVPESVTEPLRMAVGLASGFLGGECQAP